MFKKRVEPKEVERFKKLLKKTYSYIKDKEFKKAIAEYNRIDRLYKQISESQKTLSLQADMGLLYRELEVYLRINEAYVLAESGNLAKLKQELEVIHNLTYEIESKQKEHTKPLLDYISKHYKFCLDIYTYKMTREKFQFKLEEVEKLMDENNMQGITKKYSHLLVAFNKLEPYLDEYEKADTYYKLKGLFKHISVSSLLKKAMSKIKRAKHKTKFKEPEISKEIGELKILEEYRGPNIQQYKFKDEYKEVVKAIEEGDYEKATQIYKNL